MKCIHVSTIPHTIGCAAGDEDDGAVQLGALACLVHHHLPTDVHIHGDADTDAPLWPRSHVQQPLAHLPHPRDLHCCNHRILVRILSVCILVDRTWLVYHLLLMLPCEMAVGFVPGLFIVKSMSSRVM